MNTMTVAERKAYEEGRASCDRYWMQATYEDKAWARGWKERAREITNELRTGARESKKP